MGDPSDVQFDVELVLPSLSGLVRAVRLMTQFKDSQNNVFFELANTSTGVTTAKIYERIGNVATEVASISLPFATNTADNLLTAQVEKVGSHDLTGREWEDGHRDAHPAESDALAGAYRAGRRPCRQASG
ncbi:hypothetical protein [Microbacterium oleivorans]|uniref:hypothetical protein n=1 Tax=Microbacterium oleivorans TaxID=273677 RepID=UPI0011461ED1|nr:hypothetical protein [Microbacterium oleivorans]